MFATDRFVRAQFEAMHLYPTADNMERQAVANGRTKYSGPRYYAALSRILQMDFGEGDRADTPKLRRSLHREPRACSPARRIGRYSGPTPFAKRLVACVANPADRAHPITPAQVVKCTALAHFEIDGPAYPGGKSGDSPCSCIELPYPSAA
jgi:hypothetical protein